MREWARHFTYTALCICNGYLCKNQIAENHMDEWNMYGYWAITKTYKRFDLKISGTKNAFGVCRKPWFCLPTNLKAIFHQIATSILNRKLRIFFGSKLQVVCWIKFGKRFRWSSQIFKYSHIHWQRKPKFRHHRIQINFYEFFESLSPI